MNSESQGLDPYDAVIADLKEKRDRIDQTIQQLESLRTITGAVAATLAPLTSHARGGGGTGINDPGAFLGMTIADAAHKVLTARRQPLGNADLAAAFKSGGLVMSSVDPINTVGSVLTRRFNQVGDIVRVSRGVWGLAEWYPNRNFKKKAAKADDGAAEQPGKLSPEAEALVS